MRGTSPACGSKRDDSRVSARAPLQTHGCEKGGMLHSTCQSLATNTTSSPKGAIVGWHRAASIEAHEKSANLQDEEERLQCRFSRGGGHRLVEARCNCTQGWVASLMIWAALSREIARLPVQVIAVIHTPLAVHARPVVARMVHKDPVDASFVSVCVDSVCLPLVPVFDSVGLPPEIEGATHPCADGALVTGG